MRSPELLPAHPAEDETLPRTKQPPRPIANAPDSASILHAPYSHSQALRYLPPRVATSRTHPPHDITPPRDLMGSEGGGGGAGGSGRMAPRGSRSSVAHHSAPTGPGRSSTHAQGQTRGHDEEPPQQPAVQGPHPGTITLPKQFCVEQQLRRLQRATGCDAARETSYRLQGIQLIDSVRLALRLPVKTFNTACTYYHMFRLSFRDAEYNFQDAALSSLFVACKVEDTIKKSKEILCAAYNLKTPENPTTQDDKIFDQPTKIVIGLERHILQTIGFDFRVRYPQKYIIKVVRKHFPSDLGKRIFDVAYPMSTDTYKTFAPIKQTTFTLVLAVVELSARLLGQEERLEPVTYHTDRATVVETMLDLLDLYTEFQKKTRVGLVFDADRFIQVKIKINQEVDASPDLERFPDMCDRCEAEDDRGVTNPPTSTMTPGSGTSPATAGSGGGVSGVKKSGRNGEATMRFAFDAVQVQTEENIVYKYFLEEYEEYEIEVEEEVRDTHHNSSHQHRQNHHGNNHEPPHGPAAQRSHGHGSRRDRGNNHHDSGWPYPRGRHGGGRGHDRNSGRKGGGGGGGGRGGGYY